MAGNNNQNGWLNSLGIGYGTPLSVVPEQQPGTSEGNQFEQLDRAAVGSSTLKVKAIYCCEFTGTKIHFTISHIFM